MVKIEGTYTTMKAKEKAVNKLLSYFDKTFCEDMPGKRVKTVVILTAKKGDTESFFGKKIKLNATWQTPIIHAFYRIKDDWGDSVQIIAIDTANDEISWNSMVFDAGEFAGCQSILS